MFGIERKNMAFYLGAIFIFVVLKFLYSNFNTAELFVLLKPTTVFIDVLTGAESIYMEDKGFFYESLNIIINKSCSGYHFLGLCFVMLSFLSIKYFDSNLQKTMILVFAFLGAYIITIFVNSSRIIASLFFQKNLFHATDNLQGIVHESIGLITNLSFLILTYLIVEKILIHKKNNAKLT